MVSPQTITWLETLNETLPHYLQTLAVPDQPGRFLPCVKGVTRLGRRVALGFSCFALKIHYTLGLWQQLTKAEQKVWLDFIKSFQTDGNPLNQPTAYNAFLDPSIVYDAYAYTRYPTQLLYQVYPYLRRPWIFFQRMLHPENLTHQQRVIIADTKQAIATLAEVGESAERPYRGFPVTEAGVKKHLQGLDWTRPWEAGGQAAAIAVFIHTEAPKFLARLEIQRLFKACNHFFESIVDPQTGAYFKGSCPAYGQLVNGSMKVLTALDWLETPIHYPDKLIDTCLERLPRPDGCHLVDVVYVLYRCLQQTQHNKTKIQTYSLQILEMIKRHYNPDGGFSYNIGQSQTGYYGVFIARGLAESDIHGTILLTWAISMILEILDINSFNWRVIKP